MSAFVYREYTLLCDHDGCTEQYGPLGYEASRAHLRKLAAKAGWTYVSLRKSQTPRSRDQDFCPPHKPSETKP